MFSKKALAAGLLLVLIAPVLADEASWKLHNENWRRAFDTKNFTEAVKEAEAAVADAEQSFGVYDARHAQSLDTLGETYVAVGRLGEAEIRYRRAIVIRERLAGVVVAMELGGGSSGYLDRNKCGAVVASLGVFLASQPLTNSPADSRLVPSLIEMGRCQRTLGNAEVSEATLKQALKLSVNPAQIASIAEWLGQLLATQYRFTEAVEFFKRAAESLETLTPAQLRGTPGLVLGRLLDEMGTVLQSAGRYDDSDGCFQRWMDLSERLNVANRVPYENLARLRLRQGYAAEAESMAQRDTDRSRATILQSSPVPEAYSVLGEVYRDRGDHAAAEQVLRRALELAVQTDDSAKMHATLGDVYRGLGRNIEAEAEYDLAKSIYEKSYGGTRSPLYGAVVGEIGHLRLKQGSPIQAETLLGQALGTIQAAFGTRHPAVAQLKWYFAQLHREQGKYAEAEQDYREALDTLERALGVERPSLAPLLSDFADFLRSRQRPADAAALANRAKALGESKVHTIGRDKCVTTRPGGVKVSGHAIREGNPPPASNQNVVTLTGPGSPATAAVAPDGAFEFTGIRPGTYRVAASPNLAMQLMTVVVTDKDISGLQLIVPIAFPVVGGVTVEGGGLLPRFQITVAALTGAGEVTASRTVSLTVPGPFFGLPVPAGEYRVTSAALPAGYSVASITAGSVDLQTQSLKISSGDTPAIAIRLNVSSPPPWVKVSGRVTGRGTVSANNRIRMDGPEVTLTTPVNPDSSFEFPRLLPGVYTATLLPETQTAPPVTVVVGYQEVSNLEIGAK